MSQIDKVFRQTSEKADEEEVVRAMVKRLSALMNVRENIADSNYVLSSSDEKWHDAGDVEDDKGRMARMELGIIWNPDSEGLTLDDHSSEEDHDRLMSEAEKMAHNNAGGAKLLMNMSMNAREIHRSVVARGTLGRLVGFDEQRRPIIVNPDWDQANESERSEGSIPMFLDPESDQYQEVVLLLYGTADTEIEKQKGK